MEQLKTCPACNHDRIEKVNTIRDHFLSKTDFDIWKCNNCLLLFTNPRPFPEDLQAYYQSDEYLSHDASDKGLVARAYKSIRNIALDQKYRLIGQYKKEGKILDVGCGTGEFLHHMKKKGWETTGIEPAKQARDFAGSTYALDVYPEENLDTFPRSSFDVISLWHVLEHVSDLNGRIDQLKKLLKDDGLLVFALPNHLSPDALHYKNYWAAWDVPRHLYHFSQESFSNLMKQHALNIISTRPMKFDAYYVSLLSEKYQTGKQQMISAFLNGLKSNISANRNRNNYSSLIYLVKKMN